MTGIKAHKDLRMLNIDNNIFEEPLNVLYRIINNNVIDVNKSRANNTNPSKRQWIYATLPEANDENYPRLALIQGDASFTDLGASNFLMEIDNSKTGIDRRMIRTIFSRVVKIPLTIGVFVKKKQAFDVPYSDGSIRTIKNSRLTDYLVNQIIKVLEKEKNEFNSANIDINITGISGTYEDNSFLWAKEINMEAELYNTWSEEYTDGSIIKNIITNIS